MNINRRLKESLQHMATVLQRGESLLVFPEGTRTKDGQLGVFKPTFAILSRELNIPVIPVVIRGAFDAMPTGSVVPKLFKKIDLRFLPPVYPEEKNYHELVEHVRQKILKNISTPC
ncbi:MAG: lysophospholipid acyltransferase family protein [Candidatus Vecturithrix sp.]|nr:lysophospholipid acyltransferase family protein [Candidatus Vecturithrix sp.]